jgi:hypothetical protein
MIPKESKRKQKEYQLFSDYLLMPLCRYGTKMTRIKRRDRLNFCPTSFSVSLVDQGERERKRERDSSISKWQCLRQLRRKGANYI